MSTFRVIPPERWHFLEHGTVRSARARTDAYVARHGSLAGVERHIEEFVRQWVLRELIDRHGYPEAWLGNRIVIEDPVQFGSRANHAADIAIKRHDWRTQVIIEVKSVGRSGTGWQSAVSQLESYLSAVHTATFGVLSDGERMQCIEKTFNPPNFVSRDALPAYVPSLEEVVKRVPEGPKRMRGPFVIGARYTRRQISDAVGGSVQSYLPHKDGLVVAGCFTTDLNPGAPYEVLVGDGPVIVQNARVLAAQAVPIPVFIKLGVNDWEFAGYFECTGYTEEGVLLDDRARAAGRLGEAAGLLSLREASSDKR